jgi:hypothetical protein
MSDYGRIANTPTTLGRSDVEADSSCVGWHESLLRAHNILRKVKWLLEKKTDGEVILELIALMESDEFLADGGKERG